MNFNTVLKIILICIISTSFGCVKAVYFHTSTPVSKTIETQAFDASFEPVKEEGNFFSGFMLTLTNKTGHPLEIDWNKTLYFHNKNNLGNFVFKGITPSDIKSGTVPNDIVPQGSRFSIRISPLSMIALAKTKDFDAANKGSGLSAGILPEGMNTIVLVVNNNGEMIKKTISVVIKEEEK